MKTTFAFLFLCFSFLPLDAADELLIPTALNALVPKIHAGMTVGEVEALFSLRYPNVKGKRGLWPGPTGFIDYQLDGQLLLSVSSTGRGGKELVDQDILCYIVNRAQKRRLDTQSEYRSVPEQKGAATDDLLIPAELNALAPKIEGGMTVREVEELLSTRHIPR